MKFNAMLGSAESDLKQHNIKFSAEAQCMLLFFLEIMLSEVLLVMCHYNMMFFDYDY